MGQPALSASILVGSRVGRFLVRERLGSGGMGEVFLATDSVLKRDVALKAISAAHSGDSNYHKRLIKEAERVSQLNDEHIAKIYDVAEHGGRTFLVMEFVRGVTLRTLLNQPIGKGDFTRIAKQCLEGAAAAHAKGILHCDLKPENIMVTPAPESLVKILDFGLARRAPNPNDETASLAKSAIGGTAGYIAPEVLLGKEPDERADIFALGVIFHEMLAGAHPFRKQEASPSAETAPAAAQAVPVALKAIVTRMLAHDPAQRYASCADVLIELRRTTEAHETRRAARTVLLIVAAMLAAFLVAAQVFHIRIPWSPETVSASSRQLVVLPFSATDGAAASRAFADGLTEALAAKLGEVADRYPMEVVAASEVRAQKIADAKQARAVFGATLALEGSLQQAGDNVRVVYRFVDTRTLRQIDSGVITANAADTFAVQDRVIDKVLDLLDIELARADRGRMQAHGTSNAPAYEAYLRGRGYLQEYDRPENLDNAVAEFKRSIASDPRFSLAYAGLGQTYIRRYATARSPESVDAAQQACSQALTLEPNSAEAELCLGMLFDSTGQYEKAAGHLERATKLDPTRDEAYREAALAYEGQKQLENAEAVLRRAIALRPQYWAGYSWLASFYFRHGRYEEAVTQFQQVIKLAPDGFRGYSNLGAVYITKGKYKQAIEALQKSIEIRATGPALSNLGAALFYETRYAEAAAAYEKAAQLTPSRYQIFGNLGQAYRQMSGKEDASRNAYTEALRLAEQSLAVNSKDGAALMSAALYAAALGQAEKAERYRKSGLELARSTPEISRQSAVVLAELHRDNEALKELRRAVKAGVSTADVINDPAWRRFANNLEFQAILNQPTTQ